VDEQINTRRAALAKAVTAANWRQRFDDVASRPQRRMPSFLGTTLTDR